MLAADTLNHGARCGSLLLVEVDPGWRGKRKGFAFSCVLAVCDCGNALRDERCACGLFCVLSECPWGCPIGVGSQAR